MKKADKISFSDAKNKIESWCAYQDRCHSEVYKKLQSYGLDYEDTNLLLAHLVEFNFLNEQRFAESFVSGRFNIKKWGKIKITNHLKAKHVSERCIQTAIQTIDEDAYKKQLFALAQKKWEEKKGDTLNKKAKVFRYLSMKGYEFDLIYEVLDKMEDNRF